MNLALPGIETNDQKMKKTILNIEVIKSNL